MSQGQQSNLQSIFSYSLPGVHLVQLSLVKQASVDKDYKKQHFCFLSLAPGEQTQTGRTFNMNNRINLKIDAHQAIALAHAIRAVARNQEAMIGQWSIYVDSSKSQFSSGGQGGKMVFIKKTVDQKTQSPNVVIFFKQGQANALASGMMVPVALAFADVCEFIGQKCLELEFGRVHIGTTGVSNNASFPSSAPPAGSSDPFFAGAGNPGASAPPFGGSSFTPGPSQTPNGVVDNFTGAFPGSSDDDVPF